MKFLLSFIHPHVIPKPFFFEDILRNVSVKFHFEMNNPFKSLKRSTSEQYTKLSTAIPVAKHIEDLHKKDILIILMSSQLETNLKQLGFLNFNLQHRSGQTINVIA